MARQESAREDLMREAVALVRRIELQIEGEPAPVVIGCRRDGALSIFFGEDPAVHFNSRGELRRGYQAGRLIKAEQGRLVSLTRVRTPEETQLIRHELSDEETAAHLDELSRRIAHLRDAVDSGAARELRRIPAGKDVVSQMRELLRRLRGPLKVADAPHVR